MLQRQTTVSAFKNIPQVVIPRAVIPPNQSPSHQPPTQDETNPRNKNISYVPPTPPSSPTSHDPPRIKKSISYYVPENHFPSLNSLADMKLLPNPALLCDQTERLFYTSSKLHREQYIAYPMSILNDYFEILTVFAECNKWSFHDWATNDTTHLNLKLNQRKKDDVGESGDVVTDDDEVIGYWFIEPGYGSYGIIQEPSDVTVLHKKKLENRIHIHYKNKHGVMCVSLMYIVKHNAVGSYYLQEEMSWFRIVCDEEGRNAVKMVNIFGQPVRSAIQNKIYEYEEE